MYIDVNQIKDTDFLPTIDGLGPFNAPLPYDRPEAGPDNGLFYNCGDNTGNVPGEGHGKV